MHVPKKGEDESLHTIELLAISTNEEGSALEGCTCNAEFSDLGDVLRHRSGINIFLARPCSRLEGVHG